MTSPYPRIDIDCPRCHHRFKAWHLPPADPRWKTKLSSRDRDRLTNARCPVCKAKFALSLALQKKEAPDLKAPPSPSLS